ncbi:hypothetical protein N7448_009360 [Penicillium atrosanguineum]|uniref:Uncharacterized protein n=1 Tax=Penicillium atrosanguineum TaxID=1132637 RepID=A0A9W9PZY5_9EURO|nr:hypothetical protein N7448_009360 [Penicillium atrosanguineum]KAJ5141893.1 hypothetical protein N7526_002888 [Penicillium atrosanguineum]KAJ5321244.1 hypothetical protein N7476_004246 [Penicillium atrosanguineum]
MAIEPEFPRAESVGQRVGSQTDARSGKCGCQSNHVPITSETQVQATLNFLLYAVCDLAVAMKCARWTLSTNEGMHA